MTPMRSEWTTPEHALAYLQMADRIPHRTEGEATLLEEVPKVGVWFMKRIRFFLLLLACFVPSLSPLAGDDQPLKDNKKYASMPWHLVDTWWDVGKETPFESLAVDVTISDDVPSSVNLYIAPIGLGHLSKTPFYGGIQTQTDGYTKKDQKLRRIGPGFLFSMWGERSHDAIRPSEGGYCQSSGHEGDFVSVPPVLRLEEGQVHLPPDPHGPGDDRRQAAHLGRGVCLFAREGREPLRRRLRFKGEKLVLDGKVANFVEVYGRRRPAGDIPKVTVTFGPPVVNGKAGATPSAEAVYPKGVPDYADAVAKDGSLVITVGKPVEGRDKRRVKLISGKK